MKEIRKQLIIWLFKHSQKIYTVIFKQQQSWKISRNQLLDYPKHTFGWHLGYFLELNNFELIPKVERHDCYHVLCGYGTNVEDEIALQCLCYGNGKRSPYLYSAIILGIIILPDYHKYYLSSYKIGKQANAFHHYNYRLLLQTSIEDLRQLTFTKKQINNLHLNINI